MNTTSEQTPTATPEQRLPSPPPALETKFTRGDWNLLLFWLICFVLMWITGLLHWLPPR